MKNLLNKEKYKEYAKQNFYEGYNCSQAVVLAFQEILPVSKEHLLRISSSFGGGVARCREICGAISGVAIVIGLLFGYDTPDTGDIKNSHYERVQDIIKQFKKIHKGITCYELLNKERGIETPKATPRTTNFYKERPCSKYIETATELICDYINSHIDEIHFINK